MKSWLGFTFAAVVAIAFGTAFWLAVRPGASWTDQQWLFLAALPYTWTVLTITGAVDFSADAPGEVVAAFGSEVFIAYLAGAALAGLGRRGRAMVRRRA